MNGYKNYETWNVALWIGNDEFLYTEARRSRSYKRFVQAMKELEGTIAFETPDGVAWNNPELDIDELDEILEEL